MRELTLQGIVWQCKYVYKGTIEATFELRFQLKGTFERSSTGINLDLLREASSGPEKTEFRGQDDGKANSQRPIKKRV